MSTWEVFRRTRGSKGNPVRMVSVLPSGMFRFSSGCMDLFGGATDAIPMIDREGGAVGFKASNPGANTIKVRRDRSVLLSCKSLVWAMSIQPGRYPVTVTDDGIIVVTVGKPGGAE